MTRRCTRFGSALLPAFVGDAEQDRLLGGRGASVWLGDSVLCKMERSLGTRVEGPRRTNC
jgi:hypothetical protein